MLDQTPAQTAVQASGAPQAAVPPAERATGQTPPGVEYLLFICRGVPCAVPLGELRAVLRAVPNCVALPFSPPWLLGVFAHRTELLGLVDPAPLLFDAAPRASDPVAPPPAATLIVGHDDQQIGLAVETLGEIVVIHPEEIEESAAAPSGPLGEPFVAPSYLCGRYQPATASGTGSATAPYAVVDLESFVAALLEGLREEAAHA